MVICITGMSGSGKSFYAKKIFQKLQKKKKKVFIIDGDDVRKYITYNLGYSLNDRQKNSKIISDLCKYFESKNYLVICSILSIFRDHQKRNRKFFNKYIQISIEVPTKKLIKRNNKSIYNKRDVVGKNIKFPKPYRPDLLINNEFNDTYKANLKKIIALINAK